MARLPIPGSDDGKWGQILNEYLSQSHESTGALKPNTVGTSQLQENAVVASKLANGSVMSTALADNAVTHAKLAAGAVTKVDVGLGNVDNTSDVDKPISTATQTALDTKLNIADLNSQPALMRNRGLRGVRRSRTATLARVVYGYLVDSTLDAAPDGWTARGNMTADWTVKGTTRSPDGFQIEHDVPTGTTAAFLTCDAVGDVTDVEIRVSMTNTSRSGPAVRVNAAGTSGYVVRYTSGTLYLEKVVSGTATTLATASMTIQTADHVYVRLLASGTTIKAKVWQAVNAEPTTGGTDNDGYQLKATDSDLTSGYAGLHRRTGPTQVTQFYGVTFGLGAGQAPPDRNAHLAVASSTAAFNTLYTTTHAAVFCEATNQTYITWLGVQRQVYARAWSHTLGTWASTAVLVADYGLLSDSDAHGAPSIAVDRWGHLCIMFGGHNNIPNTFARSPEPYSLAGTWATSDPFPGVGSTYPHMLTDPVSGDLFCFVRAGTGHGYLYPTHEYTSVAFFDGISWSSLVPLIDTVDTPEAASDPYLFDVITLPEGGFAIVWAVARGASHDGDRINYYVARFDPKTEQMYRLDGTLIGDVLGWADHDDVLAFTTPHAEALARLAVNPADDRLWIALGDYENPSPDTTGRIWAGSYDAAINAWGIDLVTTVHWTKDVGAAPSASGPQPGLRFRQDDGTLDLFVPGKRSTTEAVRLERWNAVVIGGTATFTRQETLGWGNYNGNEVGMYRCQVPLYSRDDACLLMQTGLLNPPGNPQNSTTDVTSLFVWGTHMIGEGATF